MKKTISLALLSTTLLAACGNQEAENGGDQADSGGNQATVEFTDPAGHQVSLPEDPERLAVFDNGQLDILADLNLADRVVVTASENMPDHLSEYADLPVAGTLHEVDLEVTNAEDPDMAIVAGRSRESFDPLNEFLPTVDLSNHSENIWESIQVNLGHYGSIFNLEEEAQALEDDLAESLSNLQDQTADSDLNSLVLMTNEGSLAAYGSGSRFGFIHDLFGFEPVDDTIEESRHGMDVSFEYVLEQDPDVIFVIDRTAVVGGEETGDLEDNPLIQETKAYDNDKIIYLSPDVWYLSEGGTQAFQLMIDEASQALN